MIRIPFFRAGAGFSLTASHPSVKFRDMRTVPVRAAAGRAILGAALLLLCLQANPAETSAASYPRRIAIAPFSVLTGSDIGATVSVLPRLLSSRLMALAGADVVLLPAGGKAPPEAARDANVPLLLQGTVARLGKGYSIDVTVTDLSSGKIAGAFFAAAPTEDDIIARLGVLSGEISEKVFGVRGAIRAVSPAPAAAAPMAAPQPASGVPVAGVPAASVSPGTSAPRPAPVPAALSEGWTPSSLKKLGQSDKISDELYGVVAGDVDGEGNGEVIAWGRNTIYVYRVKGSGILPYTRISRGISHHFLAVGAIDLNGDGKKDLVVSDKVEDRIASFVLLRKGADFVEAAPGTVPYHLAVLQGWNGKTVVAGQSPGFSDAFLGKISVMKWDGTTFKEAETLGIDTSILPVSAGGVYGLAPWPSDREGRWLYMDVDGKLRVLDARGKSAYKSNQQFGGAADKFEYGEYSQLEGKFPSVSLRRAPGTVVGPKGDLWVLLTATQGGMFYSAIGSFESSHVAILKWEGGSFEEKASSPRSDFFLSGMDLLPPGTLRKGEKMVASVIEQQGSVLKDRVSRLALFEAE